MADEPLSSANVCAVMVTYNPDPSFEQNVQALVPQVGKLILVDNHSSPDAREMIARVARNYGVEVLWNEDNRGIAGGLNRGIDRVVESQEFSWIATFDQDSRVLPGYVTHMLDTYRLCPFRENVALVGASYALDPFDLPIPGSPSAQAFVRVKTVMTSGTMVKTTVFAKCGRFDDSLFMDYVDHEFCLRVHQHGFQVIQSQRALLVHRLGSPTIHRILGKPVRLSNYSSSRHYFNAHNRVLVYRRYFSSETTWVLRDICMWAKETAKVIMLETSGPEKMKEICRGIGDAIRGSLNKPVQRT